MARLCIGRMPRGLRRLRPDDCTPGVHLFGREGLPLFMHVRVLFFGMLKELAGRSQDELDLRSGSSVADLLAHYGSSVAGFQEVLASLAVAVNQQYCVPATMLNDQDEVALLPPVSGGSFQQDLHERS